MVRTILTSLLVVIALLVGCDLGQKEIDQKALQKFFSKNRVGSSPDYAVMKNGTDHLLTVHGYANDLDVCQRFIEPYNNDPSLSVMPGSYTCVPLNR